MSKSTDQSLVLIGAHADDIELHAGGYAAQFAQQGSDVHFVMMTNNMSGNLLPGGKADAEAIPHPPAQTRDVRHREQQAAADLIGAKTHFLEYPQRHYWNGKARITLSFKSQEHDALPASSDLPPLLIAAQNPQAIERMGELLVSLKPRAIITQTITDVDPEHHATAALVWQAYRLRADELKGVPLLFWAPGTSSQAGMLPQHFDFLAPITQEQFDLKMQMLHCHASQMTTRRLVMAEARARYWGQELGIEFAEPFTTVFNGL